MSKRVTTAVSWSAIVSIVTICGCDMPPPAPDKTLGTPLDQKSMHRFYEPMIDNAAAHDMSVADIHFVPHTTELNDLGAKRVDRLIKVLERYGGIVRYESLSKDDEMIDARIASVERYLETAGMDMTRIEVKSMMSGGRGATAARAIAAEQRQQESIQAGALESTSSSGSQ